MEIRTVDSEIGVWKSNGDVSKKELSKTKLIFDPKKSNAIFASQPWKVINTGHIELRFRVSKTFLVIEHVLVGFQKSFLESVQVFHLDGFFVGERYQIRNTKVAEYDEGVSITIAKKMLEDFVVLDKERIKDELKELYNFTGYHDFEFSQKIDQINKFIK